LHSEVQDLEGRLVRARLESVAGDGDALLGSLLP
jgi:hypothetical protein